MKKYIAKSKRMLQRLDHKYEMYLFEEVYQMVTGQVGKELKKFNNEISTHFREFIMQEKMSNDYNDDLQR